MLKRSLLHWYRLLVTPRLDITPAKLACPYSVNTSLLMGFVCFPVLIKLPLSFCHICRPIKGQQCLKIRGHGIYRANGLKETHLSYFHWVLEM